MYGTGSPIQAEQQPRSPRAHACRTNLLRAVTAAAARSSERSNQEDAVTKIECDWTEGERRRLPNIVRCAPRSGYREKGRLQDRERILEVPLLDAGVPGAVRHIVEHGASDMSPGGLRVRGATQGARAMRTRSVGLRTSTVLVGRCVRVRLAVRRVPMGFGVIVYRSGIGGEAADEVGRHAQTRGRRRTNPYGRKQRQQDVGNCPLASAQPCEDSHRSDSMPFRSCAHRATARRRSERSPLPRWAKHVPRS